MKYILDICLGDDYLQKEYDSIEEAKSAEESLHYSFPGIITSIRTKSWKNLFLENL